MLHVGPQAICKVLSSLPKSSHPLNDASKFVVDTLQQPGPSPEYPDLLVVVVHGEHQERTFRLTFITGSMLILQAVDPVMGTRSFDRTFILAPAPAGSP